MIDMEKSFLTHLNNNKKWMSRWASKIILYIYSMISSIPKTSELRFTVFLISLLNVPETS